MNEYTKTALRLEGWTIEGHIMWRRWGRWKLVVNTKTEKVKLYKLIK